MNQWLAAAPRQRGRLQPARAAWSRSTTCATGRRSRSDDGCVSTRRPPDAHHRHPARAARLGGPGACSTRPRRTLFCGDLFTQIGEGPAHRARRRPDPARPRRRGHVRRDRAHGRDRARRSAASPTSSLVRWPSCTAPPSPATAPGRCLDLADAYEARLHGVDRDRRRWRLMRQELTADSVERYIEASPEALYDIIADVTRTPELTPDIVRCEWLDGATGAVVGARFKAINKQGGVRTGATSRSSRRSSPVGRSPGPAPSPSPARSSGATVLAGGHRHAGHRVVRGDQAADDRRLVHHRHALRDEGPPQPICAPACSPRSTGLRR